MILNYWQKFYLKLSPFQQDFFILIVLFICIHGLGLFFPRDLWVQDEARYGDIVRDMLTTGRWFVPHLNDYPYPDKPPLYFWLVILVGMIIGHGEIAFRMVSILSTAAATAGVYALAYSLAGREIARASSLIFMGFFLTLIVNAIVRMDMLLTAATVWAWWALMQFIRTNSYYSLNLFWLLNALTLAIKGPIGWLFTLLPALGWQMRVNGWKGLQKLRINLGLFMIVSMITLWIGAVLLLNQQDYLINIWQQQLIGRAIKSWSQPQPFYFYIVLLPFLLLPYTILVLHGFYKLYSKPSELTELLLIFTILPLLTLSLISGKLFIYLEPLMPVFALVAGIGIINPSTKIIDISKTIVALIWLFILIFVLIYLPLYIDISENYFLIISIIFGLSILVIWGFLTMKLQIHQWLIHWSLITACVSLLIFGGLSKVLNPLFSARSLGESVQYHGFNQPIAVTNATRGIFSYYVNRPLLEIPLEQVKTWLIQNPQGVLIMKETDANAILQSEWLKTHCKVREKFNLELKNYYVLSRC